MEGTDRGAAKSLTATGARKVDIVACATMPAAIPSFISMSLYALEKAVRSSTILGLVGAGGIGIELKVGFDLFDDPTAMTVILMIAVVVISIEHLSVWARTKIIGEQRRNPTQQTNTGTINGRTSCQTASGCHPRRT